MSEKKFYEKIYEETLQKHGIKDTPDRRAIWAIAWNAAIDWAADDMQSRLAGILFTEGQA